MLNFEFVETKEDLQKACEEMKGTDELGIDLECENNLHHYGAYISIIQVSSEKKNWIIDVLTIKDIKPLIDIMEYDRVTKIFHDVNFDLRILKYQFGCRPRNIFDTQIAAKFLGKTDLGLGSLLEEYFHVKKEKKFQMIDWTIRPLGLDMLSYAVIDSSYLIRLKARLTDELREKGRITWVEEESWSLENGDYDLKNGGFFDLKGLNEITPKERAILKRLYDLRETIAKRVNRPIHYIISTKMLFEIASRPPNSPEFWKNLRRVHPAVKNYALAFSREVSLGTKEEIELEQKERKKFSARQRDLISQINEYKDKVAADIDIPKHVLLCQEQVKEIVLQNSLKPLKNWQREIMGNEIQDLLDSNNNHTHPRQHKS